MAVVYEALHLRLNQRLAIKVLRPNIPEFEEVLARFEREARATVQLRSIHSARVVDVDTLADGLPYIVMEFLEGFDLEKTLETTGPMSIEDAADIVIQVTDVMAEAHSLGIVHRDLKPSNLFVCHVGDRRLIKVLDFGISKIENEMGARITQADSYFGTPCYAAPEQLRAAAEADARSDVWSLGIILFELLTGRPPFVGNPTAVIAKVMTDPVPWPLDLRPDIPRELARIILRALSRHPSQRYQSMRDLAAALVAFAPAQTAASVVEAQRTRGRLGEILVSEGLMRAADLARALEEQRRSGKLLGRVLLEMGLVSHADMMTALAKQQGLTTSVSRGSEGDVRAREAPTRPPRFNRRWAIGLVLILALPAGILGALGVGAVLRSARAHSPPSALHR
jgi:serine/threonine-protein kinase